jgi:hypothetical protein
MVEDYNMTTTSNQQYLRIYLATWAHKHGQDISAHTTEVGAQKQLVAWARETLEDWMWPNENHPYTEYTDEDLIGNWGEISGDTEFFTIQELALNEDESYEKEKWVADTSHIGA